MKASEDLFKENAKLLDLRRGYGTYGYCAWCDVPVGSPNGLGNIIQFIRSRRAETGSTGAEVPLVALLKQKESRRIGQWQSLP